MSCTNDLSSSFVKTLFPNITIVLNNKLQENKIPSSHEADGYIARMFWARNFQSELGVGL